MISFGLVLRLKAFLVMFFLLVVAFAQETRVTGTVKDAKTSQPIEFAHVRIGDVISYTNEDGEFSLRVRSNVQVKLEVFHMGYAVYTSSELPKNGDVFSIELEPVSPSAVTDAINATDLMKDVFVRFIFNYDHNEQLLLSYYKEKITDAGEIHFLAEAIMEILVPSDVDNASVIVRPLKGRTRLLDHFSNKEVAKLNGHAADMVRSSVFMENSFLSSKNRWQYEYTLTGQEVHRGYDVFLVDFKPKDGAKGGFSGTLYIDQFSHAIIRTVYSRDNAENWTKEVWEEEFQHHDHTYYLLRASHEVSWTEGGTEHTYSSFVINTEVEPNSTKIAWEQFIEGKNFLFPLENTGSLGDDYWGRFNYIPLSSDEKSQLK